MKLSWDSEAWQQYIDWQQNKQIFKKLNEILKDILRNPIEGIGKPEPLKHDFSGYYSRRINEEHRIIYKVLENEILIISCKNHYEK